jgi:serine/threonine protein kinase
VSYEAREDPMVEIRAEETSQSRRRFRLDGYDVGKVIGRGGFAVVYAAREEAFDRAVAIKVVTGRERPTNPAR